MIKIDEAHARDIRQSPTSETGAMDARDMWYVETAREREWRGGRL